MGKILDFVNHNFSFLEESRQNTIIKNKMCSFSILLLLLLLLL